MEFLNESSIPPEDKRLSNLSKEINNTKDLLHNCARLIAERSEKAVLTEAAVTESLRDQLFESQENQHDYRKDMPSVVPYFTPDEYRNLNESSPIIGDFDYIFMENGKDYVSVIRKLQSNMGINPKNSRYFEEMILRLGWNPHVEINKISLTYARNKQANWLNEHKEIQIVDVSNISTDIVQEAASSKLEPVFICLSYTGTFFGNLINWWKHSQYSHAALSLDSSLKKLWSYNRTPDKTIDGLSIESIDEYHNPKLNGDCNLYVAAAFVTKEVKKKIEDTLEWYKKNQKNTKYSFKVIAQIVLNKSEDTVYSMNMVCSQFVDNIFKIAGADISGKPNNLVSPQDFTSYVSKEKKVYKLFEGYKSKYNPKEIDKKVRAIQATLTNGRKKKNKNEIKKDMKEPKLESFFTECIDDVFIESILSEAYNILKIVPIVEARAPVGFTKKGDLYIDTPKDLEQEYKEAHRLLLAYDESNIQGIKHELARLFYLNSIIETKMKRMDKDSKEFKDLLRLRARVLNDFNTYLKLVVSIEKDFDFTTYMKQSEYYNKTVVIGSDTLKYTSKYIKQLMGIMN